MLCPEPPRALIKICSRLRSSASRKANTFANISLATRSSASTSRPRTRRAPSSSDVHQDLQSCVGRVDATWTRPADPTEKAVRENPSLQIAEVVGSAARGRPGTGWGTNCASHVSQTPDVLRTFLHCLARSTTSRVSQKPDFLDFRGPPAYPNARETPPHRGASIWKGRFTMTTSARPAQKPVNRNFSSGPCAKRPGWSLKALDNAFLGRSHRAKEGKARLKRAIEETKALLGLPAGYVCAIVPASDTGAFEMAMWTMLGQRGVDVAGLGELRRGLGDGRDQAAQAGRPAHSQGRVRQATRSRPGGFQPRRAVHLERHHIRRARAERRLDRGRPRRGSPSPTPPPPYSRSTSRGRRSMSPPSPGRRRWAARPRTAC